MPYVDRNEDGNIVARYANQQHENHEYIEHNDQDLIAPVTLNDYDIAIERHLDSVADAAGYYDPLGRIPNIDRACAYAAFANEYQTESQGFVAWRASVWAYVFTVKSEVEAGNRPQPTIEELIAELPIKN